MFSNRFIICMYVRIFAHVLQSKQHNYTRNSIMLVTTSKARRISNISIHNAHGNKLTLTRATTLIEPHT